MYFEHKKHDASLPLIDVNTLPGAGQPCPVRRRRRISPQHMTRTGRIRERTSARYAWIEAQQVAYPVSALCRALGVSRSGFHAWLGRVPSAREQADSRLATVIGAMHMEHRQAYGTRRLWRVLVGRGEACGRHRAARLRRRHGVITLQRRRFLRARATYQRVPAAPNRLAWPFVAATPDRVWVGDITHLATREGWLYLATVLDVCSRRIVGWAMASQQTLALAERALHMAIVHRRPAPVLILHHD